jgi:hypothetical protein
VVAVAVKVFLLLHLLAGSVLSIPPRLRHKHLLILLLLALAIVVARHALWAQPVPAHLAMFLMPAAPVEHPAQRVVCQEAAVPVVTQEQVALAQVAIQAQMELPEPEEAVVVEHLAPLLIRAKAAAAVAELDYLAKEATAPAELLPAVAVAVAEVVVLLDKTLLLILAELADCLVAVVAQITQHLTAHHAVVLVVI